MDNKFTKQSDNYVDLFIMKKDQESIPFWPLVAVGLASLMIWIEYGSQDCLDPRCKHRVYVPKKNLEKDFREDFKKNLVKDFREDSKKNLVKEIDYLIDQYNLNHMVVNWRRSILIAIIVGIIILLFLSDRFPNGFTFFMVSFFIFLVYYFSTSWIQHARWRKNGLGIIEDLENLRKCLNK